ncbi:MAG: hypothetical protein NG740_04285 [Omnitrophica bacterium]|nr:hypothetical protein [Candidatus Omnitrophota bacterium]
MGRISLIVVLAVFVSIFSGTFAPDSLADGGERPEWMPEITADVMFETKYIWRGQNLGNDPVIQIGTGASLVGLSFAMWGNYDTGPLDRFTEWDYLFDYTFNVGEATEWFGMGDKNSAILDLLSASVGYTYYTFPNLPDDKKGTNESHEPYASLSYDVLFQPFLTVYMDVDTGGGTYWEYGVSHAFELSEDIEAGLGITGGYNAGQWGFDWSFSNLLFSGEVGIPIFEYFTISPNVNYSLPLDDQYDAEFYGGVNINATY